MRKIIVITMITLDGVMQAPGGPEEDTSSGFKYGGWTAPFSNDNGAISSKKICSLQNIYWAEKHSRFLQATGHSTKTSGPA